MSLPFAGRSGLLRISQENEFSETSMGRSGNVESFYFCGINWVFNFPFPFLGLKRKYICVFSRAWIKASVQNFQSILEQCPGQHQASLVCIPCCSPSVHWVWDLYGCGPHELMQESQKREFRLGDYVFPKFYGFAVTLPILANSWFPRLEWQAFSPISPQLTVHVPIFPFVQSLSPIPQHSAGNGPGIPWRVWSCSLLVKLSKYYACHVCPPFCSFPILITS